MRLGAKARLRRLEKREQVEQEPDAEVLTLLLSAELRVGVTLAELGMRPIDYAQLRRRLADLRNVAGPQRCEVAFEHARQLCRSTTPPRIVRDRLAALDSLIVVLKSWTAGDMK